MRGLLDGINPDGTSGWSDIAGFMLASALVLLIIAVGVGLVMGIWGRHTLSTGTARKGWAVTALAGIAAMVLGSLSGGIAWGISQGTASLMPEGARPQAVTVEKQAPKQTCREDAVRNFEDEDNPPPNAERVALVERLVGDHPDLDEEWRRSALIDAGADATEVTLVRWRAASGPDCSGDNETVEACTTVHVEQKAGSGLGTRMKNTDFEVGGDSC